MGCVWHVQAQCYTSGDEKGTCSVASETRQNTKRLIKQLVQSVSLLGTPRYTKVHAKRNALIPGKLQYLADLMFQGC